MDKLLIRLVGFKCKTQEVIIHLTLMRGENAIWIRVH